MAKERPFRQPIRRPRSLGGRVVKVFRFSELRSSGETLGADKFEGIAIPVLGGSRRARRRGKDSKQLALLRALDEAVRAGATPEELAEVLGVPLEIVKEWFYD